MTKRDTELAYARIAGYHQDSSDFTRRLVERKSASFQAMQQAYRVGVRQKQSGMKCGCCECNRGAK